MIVSLLGIIGSLALTLGGIPQLIKAIKDGHAMGLASGTLLCWVVGFMALVPYVLITHSEDIILCVNYVLNMCITAILVKYRYWPRKISS